MKFAVGFIAGASIAAGALMMINPIDMRKMRRKCKCAKKIIKGMM